jgi:hypothetical protein
MVPNGFLENIRALASYYQMQDSLWEMKVRLLVKINNLSRNIFINYVSPNKKKLKKEYPKLKASIETIAAILKTANGQIRAAGGVMDQFKKIEASFDSSVVSQLQKDRSQSFALLDAVKRQTDYLAAKGGASDLQHVELLKHIRVVLQDRIGQINESIASRGGYQIFPNPLHLPDGIGITSESKALTEAYKLILHQFISQTQEKIAQAKYLYTTAQTIKKAAIQEGVFYKSFVGGALKIKNDAKRKITATGQELISNYIITVKGLEAELAEVLTQAAALDFRNPDEIIASIEASSKAFTINQRLSNLVNNANSFIEESIQLDTQLYGMLSGTDLSKVKNLEPYKVLQTAHSARNKTLEDFESGINAIRSILQSDAITARNLKNLGHDILSKGRDFYRIKGIVLDTFINDLKSESDKPYYAYMTGVREILDDRFQNVDKLVSLAKKYKIDVDRAASCTDCIPPEAVWPDLATVGNAFSETLMDFDALQDIETFFKKENLTSNSVFTDAQNYFDMGRRLKTAPYLRINPDSIDVVFNVGTQMIVLKGIGDPKALSLSGLQLENDYLLNPPHIGGWLSSLANAGKNLITPITRTVSDSASSVINGARAIGGKIYSGAQQARDIAVKNIKSGLQTVKNYGARAADAASHLAQDIKNVASQAGTAAGHWARNAYRNAFMDGDKHSAWKIGLYAFGAVACGVAAAGTAGLAAAPCLALAVNATVDVSKGYVDTAAMPQYGMISKENADRVKLGLDIAGIVAGGAVNIYGAGDAWQKMSRVQKVLTAFGVNPDDFKSLGNLSESVSEISKIASRVKKADAISKILGGVDAVKNAYDWYDKTRPLHDEFISAAELIGYGNPLQTQLIEVGQSTAQEIYRAGELLGQAAWHSDPLLEYGNWYGPGYWGGDRMEDRPGDQAPINSLDAIAMRHDFAYEIAEEQGRIYGPGEEQRIKAIADAIAVREAQALGSDPTQWPMPASDPETARRYQERMAFGFGYTAPGRSAAGQAMDAYDWVTSPIESYVQSQNDNRLTEQNLQTWVNSRVNDWYADHPQAVASGSTAPGSGPGATGQAGSSADGVSGQPSPEGTALTGPANTAGGSGRNNGQNQSGVALGSNTSSSQTTTTDWVNPNQTWENPKKNWANPNKDWVNPYKNWKSKY